MDINKIPMFQVPCRKCGAEVGTPCGYWEGRPVGCYPYRSELVEAPKV